MKKLLIEKAGGYEQLKIIEAPDLSPLATQVKVDIHGIGVNYADCLVRWGVYESAKQLVGWPITPGFEFSGIVSGIGSQVTKYKVGDRVYGVHFFNSYASQICVTEDYLFPVPANGDLVQFGGFPVVYMTAYHALFQIVKIYPNARILVHSAAGGVGSALVKIAKLQGLHVTGVIGGSHKKPYAMALGMDEVIDKSSEDLWQRAKSISPKGFDAIFDANGFSTYRESYNHLRPTGKLVCYGNHQILPLNSSSGKMNYAKAMIGLLRTPKFDPLDMITNNKSVAGFNLSFLFERKDLLAEIQRDFQPWLEKNDIGPLQTTVIDFQEVEKAHRFIESGKSIGKIVLKV